MHRKFAFGSQHESSDSAKKLSPGPRLNKVLIPIGSFDSKPLSPGKRDARSPAYGLWIQEYPTNEYADFGNNPRIIVGPEVMQIEWSAEGGGSLVARAIDLLSSGG
jgi:hypothetical protein